MKVDRENLLQILTVASVGLTKREVLEQSNSYIFTEDHLITFNGEILTKVKNPLKGVEGAIPAEELHKILAKFPDPEVDITIFKGEMRIKAKRRKAGITLQKEIHLPYKDIPCPTKWRKCPEKLSGVLYQAARCCGKDESLPSTTVVHATKDKVEASDNLQLFQYAIDTGFSKPVLIPATSLASLGGLAFKKVAQKGGYLHFKMPDDHLISIRCMAGGYPDLDPHLKIPAPRRKITLPSNLEDILSRAEVMQETSIDASVTVTLDKGSIQLEARKESGWYRESKKITYDGEELKFTVHPKLLEEIFSKKKTVLIGGNRMKIRIREATFVICLMVKE